MNRSSFILCTGMKIIVPGAIMQIITVLIATSLICTVIPEELYAQTTSQAESVRELEAAQQKIQEVESDFIEALYTIAQVQARLGHREDA